MRFSFEVVKNVHSFLMIEIDAIRRKNVIDIYFRFKWVAITPTDLLFTFALNDT